jgi:hypothetical protein
MGVEAAAILSAPRARPADLVAQRRSARKVEAKGDPGAERPQAGHAEGQGRPGLARPVKPQQRIALAEAGELMEEGEVGGDEVAVRREPAPPGGLEARLGGGIGLERDDERRDWHFPGTPCRQVAFRHPLPMDEFPSAWQGGA